MSTSPFLPSETTEAGHLKPLGQWLAAQDWRFDSDGEHAWVLTAQGEYLAEGITQDSEGKLVEGGLMRRSLELMHHAPRLLRFVLRGLEVLDDDALSATTKNEHLLLLLNEVAGNCLRSYGDPLAVAKAVEEAQASAGLDEDEEQDEEQERMDINAVYACKHTHAVNVLSFKASTQAEFNRELARADQQAGQVYAKYSRDLETLTGDDEQLAWWELNFAEPK